MLEVSQVRHNQVPARQFRDLCQILLPKRQVGAILGTSERYSELRAAVIGLHPGGELAFLVAEAGPFISWNLRLRAAVPPLVQSFANVLAPLGSAACGVAKSL